MITKLIDWLTSLLVDLMIDWLIDWLINLLMNWLIDLNWFDKLNNKLIDKLIYLLNWLIDFDCVDGMEDRKENFSQIHPVSNGFVGSR